MKLLIEFFISMFAVFAFTYFFNTPRDTMILGGIIGGLSWVIFKLVLPYNNSYLFAGFLASMFIGISSEIAAIVFKHAATMYILPALLPLVPGAGIFYSMYYAINGDTVNMKIATIQTIYLIISLAIGIVASSTFARLFRFHLFNKKHTEDNDLEI